MSNRAGQMAAFAAVALAAALPLHAQIPVDDLRVRQLEAEVLRLRQQVEAQSRRIDVLEQAARITPPGAPSVSGIRAPDTSPVWLSTANWDRVKAGMTALEVMAILGRPTSTRNDEDGKLRVLFYAMELGPDKYLSGNIRLDDAGVVEINRPELK
jgi:hypothetical protein